MLHHSSAQKRGKEIETNTNASIRWVTGDGAHRARDAAVRAAHQTGVFGLALVCGAFFGVEKELCALQTHKRTSQVKGLIGEHSQTAAYVCEHRTF